MRYSFGEFSLDVDARRLLRGTDAIALQPKVFDALVYIVERRERVVSKEELLGALWPPNISESVLPRCMSALRKALDDEAGAIVKTLWGRGYRFVADVVARRAASTVPAARGSEALVSSHTTPSGRVFVGREQIVAMLEATLDHAIERGGRTVVLSGGPGSGKSRTAGTALRAALKRQAITIAVACDRRDAAPRLWPWLQIARRAVKLAGNHERHAPLIDALTAGEEGFEQREAMFGLLRDCADAAGLLILIDDIHLTDELTLRMLEHVTGQIATSRIFLLVTLREDGIHARDPLALALAGITRQATSCQHIRLDGLSQSEVARLIAHVCRTEPPADIAQHIAALTAGNPLLVEALVTALQARNWDPSALREPPLTIRAAVGRRLEALSANAAALLTTAAVATEGASLDEIARASALSHDQSLAALDEAAAAGLVEAPDATRPVVRFTPPIVRLALYEDLDHAARRQLHAQLAEVLEAATGARDGLGHHLLRTGRPDDRGRALCVLVEAAEQRGDADAFRDALASISDEHAALQVRALVGLSQVEQRAERYEVARATLRRAAVLARRRDDSQLAAVAIAMAEPFEPSPCDDAEATALARDALERTEDASLRDHLSALLGIPTPHVAAGDRSAISLRMAYYAAALPDGQTAHAAISSELSAAAARSGRTEDRAHASFVAFGAHLAADNLAAAREAARSLEALPGDAFHRWRSRWASCACALADGDVTAWREPEADAHAFAPTVALALCARRAQLTGDWDLLESTARALARSSAWVKPLASAWLALAQLRAGRPEDARHALEQELDGGVHHLACGAIVAEVADVLGEVASARHSAASLEPHANRAATHDVLRLYFGPVSLTLARLMLCIGDDRAAHFLDMAARAADRSLCAHTSEQVRALRERIESPR